MINIDYNVDPKNLLKSLDIPIQGGLHPEVLLTDKENLKKQVNKYLEIFKDHPYVFNLEAMVFYQKQKLRWLKNW